VREAQLQDCSTGLRFRVMEPLATRLQAAFNARDMDTLRELLAEDARWGDDPDAPNTCRGRAEIIANVKRLLAEGVRPSIVETTIGPRGIACLLDVEWPAEGNSRPDRVSFYQVYLVTDSLVTEIQGHDDRDSALAAISN
jgi:SnoaL-like domain